MGTIGTLSVGVTANTEKFSRGMKQARQDASMFSKGTDQLKGSLLALGGALAGAFAAKFSFDSIRQAADDLDRLGKSADTLGASTMGLGGLSRAAELAGSSGEAMAKGMSFMERAVSGGSDAFKDLNVNLNVLRHLRPEQQFLEIADAMKAVEDNGKRLQLVKDIFGKGGESLVPTMLQGSDSLRQEMAMKEGFSRSDIKGIEEANDAGKRLSQTFKDLSGTMALEFAPGIQRVMERLNTTMGGANKSEVDPWAKRFGGMDDTKFMKFMSDYEATDRSMGWGIGGRQNFGGAKTNADINAVSKYFGDDAAKSITADDSRGYNAGSHMEVNAQKQAIEVAMRAREMKMYDDIRKRQAEFIEKASPSGMGGDPFGMMMPFNNFAMGQFMKEATEYKAPPPRWSSTELRRMQDTADDARASTPMGRLRDYTGDSRLSPEPGNAALEKGTAAAFTQSHRSESAARATEPQKQQVKLLQTIDKSLKGIDRNTKKTKEWDLVDIA